jgi:hypothetical protein
MLIPGAMIRNLISERAQTQLDVISEIGSKWGFGKTLNGPVLSIPYYHYIEQDDKPYRPIFYPGNWKLMRKSHRRSGTGGFTRRWFTPPC